MITKIHPQTFAALALDVKKNELVKKIESDFLKDFDAKDQCHMFAPFLKTQARKYNVEDWVLELAALEWSVYNQRIMKSSWIRGSLKTELRLNPSLEFFTSHYNLEELFNSLNNKLRIPDKLERKSLFLLFINAKSFEPQFVLAKQQWIPLLEVLREGPMEEATAREQLKTEYKILYPDSEWELVISELKLRGILEKNPAF